MGWRRRRSWTASLGAVSAAFLVLFVGAASGRTDQHDPAFAVGEVDRVSVGLAVLHIFGGTADLEGRPIVVGSYRGQGTDPYGFYARRMNMDGILEDRSFAGSFPGVVPGFDGDAEAQTALTQTDGKILLGGYAHSSTLGYTSVILRLTASGAADPGFGASGYVTASVPDARAQLVTGLAEQSDDKIVFVSAASHVDEFTVGRLNADGSLDSSFGTSGTTTVSGAGVLGYSIALQRDGGIVVGGAIQGVMTAWRFLPDGSLDATFGDDGVAHGTTPRPGTGDISYGLVVQPSGKIVLGGGSGYSGAATTDEAFALERFTTTGGLDPSFGSGGIVRTQIGVHDDEIEALVQAPDGALIAAGFSAADEDEFGLNPNASVARYSANGVLDNSFGTRGSVVEKDFLGYYNAATMLPDGRFYAFGTWYGWGGALARYTEGAPTVAFAPAVARAGDVVHVTANDVAASTTVTIGRVAVPAGDVTVVSPTQLDVTVPDDAVGGAVTVATVNGTGVSPAALGIAPRIDSISTTAGLGVGETLTILGRTFGGVTQVAVGGMHWPFTVDSSTQLRTTVPSSAVSGVLTVTNAAGSTSRLNVAVDPIIQSFSPEKATAGAGVTAHGLNLAGASVTFDGTPAVVDSSSDTSVVAEVPPDALPGRLVITNGHGDAGTSAADFTPIPTLESPGEAGAGDDLDLNGSNLGPVSSVRFAGHPVAFTRASARLVHAAVPGGTLSGTWSVTTAAGTAVSPVWWVRPEISSFSPAHGRVGTTVAIIGTSLRNVQRVKLGGTVLAFRVVSPARITVRVPAGARPGTFEVEGRGGVSASGGSFVVDP